MESGGNSGQGKTDRFGVNAGLRYLSPKFHFPFPGLSNSSSSCFELYINNSNQGLVEASGL